MPYLSLGLLQPEFLVVGQKSGYQQASCLGLTVRASKSVTSTSKHGGIGLTLVLSLEQLGLRRSLTLKKYGFSLGKSRVFSMDFPSAKSESLTRNTHCQCSSRENGDVSTSQWLILVRVGNPTKDPRQICGKFPNHFEFKFASVEDILHKCHSFVRGVGHSPSLLHRGKQGL